MAQLTHEQIIAVDKALWDIGIKFLDIRIEMTDHVATAIEGMDRSFEMNLKKYIFENKKELKKNYSQFRVNASIKAVKLLFSNIISLRFLAILISVYALVFGEYKHDGFEETSSWVFTVLFMFLPLTFMYIGYINFTQSTKLFSTTERLFPTISGAIYLMFVPLKRIVEEMEISDSLKLFYYAFIISFFIATGITYRSLTKFYKSRYQVI